MIYFIAFKDIMIWITSTQLRKRMENSLCIILKSNFLTLNYLKFWNSKLNIFINIIIKVQRKKSKPSYICVLFMVYQRNSIFL